MTCLFTGHRTLPHDCDDISASVRSAVLRLVEQGYTRFVSGGAIGFDLLCADVVLELKPTYPGIELLMLLPCRTQDAKYTPLQRRKYNDILSRADNIIWLSDEYYSGCMLERNRAMVHISSHCIAYLKRQSGGTAYTVNYSIKNGLEVEYI